MYLSPVVRALKSDYAAALSYIDMAVNVMDSLSHGKMNVLSDVVAVLSEHQEQPLKGLGIANLPTANINYILLLSSLATMPPMLREKLLSGRLGSYNCSGSLYPRGATAVMFSCIVDFDWVVTSDSISLDGVSVHSCSRWPE